jgi:hypothetical protein
MDESLMALLGVVPVGQGYMTPWARQHLQQQMQPELEFQNWFRSLPWFREFVQQYGEEPNSNDPDYDYRAAYQAGIAPDRYEYDGGRYHWPSSLPDGTHLKSENHPTMWMEQFMQQTGVDPLSLGLRTPEDAQAALANGPLGQLMGAR